MEGSFLHCFTWWLGLSHSWQATLGQLVWPLEWPPWLSPFLFWLEGLKFLWLEREVLSFLLEFWLVDAGGLATKIAMIGATVWDDERAKWGSKLVSFYESLERLWLFHEHKVHMQVQMIVSIHQCKKHREMEMKGLALGSWGLTNQSTNFNDHPLATRVRWDVRPYMVRSSKQKYVLVRLNVLSMQCMVKSQCAKSLKKHDKRTKRS